MIHGHLRQFTHITLPDKFFANNLIIAVTKFSSAPAQKCNLLKCETTSQITSTHTIR
ncbi:unnamed protein product [Brugia timori]|uniref:Uncharacterized protein n=1 Tax=Brugia timori TaxID=42155 RepID=A0A3P7SS14_9BILA|nr:unnamed protein product [Brugia timori]